MGERQDTVVRRVLAWYESAARDLPWRQPDVSPWAILVSEVMLQQTPVARVLGPWTAWLERWPTPAALAAEPSAAAVAAWGRLGYPRRALRLHQAAVAIVERHGGDVPRTYEELLALPGLGDYTAAAVASFAFGARHVVVDTNVRRVVSRIDAGVAELRPSARSRRLAESYLPSGSDAPGWAVASMELGALVCTSRSPRCGACPVADLCVWNAAGRPAAAQSVRPSAGWNGTDRQCRGALLQALRDADAPLPRSVLVQSWSDPGQADRCLATLEAEGLLHGKDPVTL